MSFRGKRFTLVSLAFVSTLGVGQALALSRAHPTTPPITAKVTQRVTSDGPLKQLEAQVEIDRAHGIGPKKVTVGALVIFNREGPPHGSPTLDVFATIQGKELQLLTAGFAPGDGSDFLWPRLDRVCGIALEAC